MVTEETLKRAIKCLDNTRDKDERIAELCVILNEVYEQGKSSNYYYYPEYPNSDDIVCTCMNVFGDTDIETDPSHYM